MSFTVTPVKQPRGSVLCGPACVSMILSRYGVRRSAQRIARDLPMTQKGIRNAPLGTYFLQQGYDVTLFFWQKGIRPRFMGTTAQNAVSRAIGVPLTAKASIGDRRAWPREVSTMRTFMDAGGDLRLEPVQGHHLELALRRGWPPIANINPRVLGRYGDTDGGHYVVPVAMTAPDTPVTRPMISFYDPISGRLHDRYVDDFMHACHVWAGSALLIRPKGSVLEF